MHNIGGYVRSYIRCSGVGLAQKRVAEYSFDGTKMVILHIDIYTQIHDFIIIYRDTEPFASIERRSYLGTSMLYRYLNCFSFELLGIVWGGFRLRYYYAAVTVVHINIGSPMWG